MKKLDVSVGTQRLENTKQAIVLSKLLSDCSCPSSSPWEESAS